jgi:hypothetical protein
MFLRCQNLCELASGLLKGKCTQAEVLMNAPTDASELLSLKIFNAFRELFLQMPNHVSDEIANEIRVWLWLFYRKPSRPWKSSSPVREREEQNPPSRLGALSQAIDERAHTVGETQPTVTCCTMLAPSKRAAWSAAAENPVHSRSLAKSRGDTPIRIENFVEIARHRANSTRWVTHEFSATWNCDDFGFANFVNHLLGTLSGIKDERLYPSSPRPSPRRKARRGEGSDNSLFPLAFYQGKTWCGATTPWSLGRMVVIPSLPALVPHGSA